jgi:hypothetical protein
LQARDRSAHHRQRDGTSSTLNIQAFKLRTGASLDSCDSWLATTCTALRPIQALGMLPGEFWKKWDHKWDHMDFMRLRI